MYKLNHKNDNVIIFFRNKSIAFYKKIPVSEYFMAMIYRNARIRFKNLIRAFFKSTYFTTVTVPVI